MNTFKLFETQVKHLSNPKDFKKNSDKLKELRLSSYDTFLILLKSGGEITTSIKASEEIFKICCEVSITQTETVSLLNRFRFINRILDEKVF